MISFYTFSTFQFGTNRTNYPTSSHLNPAYPNISRLIPQKLFLYTYMPTILLKYNDFSTKIQCFFPLFHKISFLIGLQDAFFSKSNLSEYKKQPIYYLSKLIFLRGSANINPPPMAFPTVAIRRLRKSLTIGTSGV